MPLGSLSVRGGIYESPMQSKTRHLILNNMKEAFQSSETSFQSEG